MLYLIEFYLQILNSLNMVLVGRVLAQNDFLLSSLPCDGTTMVLTALIKESNV